MLLFLLFLHSSIATSSKFVATAYTKNCSGCTGITASGIRANPHRKMMAVDPKILKLGSCYKLQFKDGHHSIYLAADTGGDIIGNRVDILMKSHESAKNFGRQHIKLLGKVKCPK
jgi:3D (Asp-Asp-Asp) domain-containing protein